jgi:geranylgeranyl diphosphate synthase type II
MLINAFLRADDAQRKELAKWIEAKDFDRTEKVNAVTNLYNEIGIDKIAEQKIAFYFEQSTKYLDAVNVSEERKAILRAYAEKMMKRKY